MPGTYAFFNFSFGELPSRYAIEDRKKPMLMGAKTNWSHATRAAMVLLVDERVTRRARKEYHVVAAGPNTARGGRVLVGVQT
jgi:hypothetical protein